MFCFEHFDKFYYSHLLNLVHNTVYNVYSYKGIKDKYRALEKHGNRALRRYKVI